jgi:hypothetical protein
MKYFPETKNLRETDIKYLFIKEGVNSLQTSIASAGEIENPFLDNQIGYSEINLKNLQN